MNDWDLRDVGSFLLFALLVPVWLPIFAMGLLAAAIVWLLVAVLKRLDGKLHLMALPDENEYYAWADIRLDELAEQANHRSA